jgi:ABC-type multidrug transport system ATPase subunit
VRAFDNTSFEIKKGLRVGLDWAQRRRQDNAAAVDCRDLRADRRPADHGGPHHAHVQHDGRVVAGCHRTRVRAYPLYSAWLQPDQIDALADEVIDFCELGRYIDMPVRTYSTGMLVRLAFALVTCVTSEILLFDELIGAGDERFVNKAQQRLQSFIEQSSILIVATHNRSVRDQWCNRAFLLEHGKLIHDGGVHDGNMISAARVKEDEKGICCRNGSLTIELCRNQRRRKSARTLRNDMSR